MVPALPFIAVGVVAAAAGWVGALWWAKHQGRHDQVPGSATGAAASAPPTHNARPLTWCPGCRTWFVAEETHGCDAPDCPLRPGG